MKGRLHEESRLYQNHFPSVPRAITLLLFLVRSGIPQKKYKVVGRTFNISAPQCLSKLWPSPLHEAANRVARQNKVTRMWPYPQDPDKQTEFIATAE